MGGKPLFKAQTCLDMKSMCLFLLDLFGCNHPSLAPEREDSGQFTVMIMLPEDSEEGIKNMTRAFVTKTDILNDNWTEPEALVILDQ